MKHLGLFEGIGGFSLAARWMGWETVAWCEWNEFCQKVLKYHFPEAEGHSDITKTDFTKYKNAIDIITGGFPCQPYSVAGKQKGTEDERHLWPEMLRAIREVKPFWVVGENVGGLVSWSRGLVFEQVQIDLEAEGYEVQPFILPAASVGAPHKRDRIWFVAYSRLLGQEKSKEQPMGLEQLCEGLFTSNTGRRNKGSKNKSERTPIHTTGCGEANNVTNSESESSRRELLQQPNERKPGGFNSEYDATNPNSRRQSGKEHREKKSGQFTETGGPGHWEDFPTQSPICDGNDGIPARLDSITFPKWRNESIKAGGNAIVPQVVFQIYKAIQQYEFMKPVPG